ncbi:MAG: NAD(P)-dependent oxidoreductase [Xanthobacteraceae bacterium]
MKIFIAGATGVIGRRLTALLRAAGHSVAGTTRSAAKVDELRARGVQPVAVNVFDSDALCDAVVRLKPQVVIHQLTDLPQLPDPSQLAEMLKINSRLRIEGTANLVNAARAAGARRLIAQSIAFAYAAGPEPHAESDPLASGEGDTPAAITARGVRALEAAVLNAPSIDGIVLRYGRLYGPGTWFETASGRGPIHVDAAAQAAFLAVTRGRPGIYNIAENDGALTVDKAQREMGFDPMFRLPGETAC